MRQLARDSATCCCKSNNRARARSTSTSATNPLASPEVLRTNTSALAVASRTPANAPRACCTSKYARATDKIASFRAVCRSDSRVADPQEMGNIPIQPGKDVYIRDVATIQDTTDINYGCALVNGRRSIYIPVVKKDTASTLTVVDEIHKAMPLFKKQLPNDVDIRYEFDESPTVRAAIKSVATEGGIGALLTGLMILIFLHDVRTVIVVVVGIPLALTAALVGLWLTGKLLWIVGRQVGTE